MNKELLEKYGYKSPSSELIDDVDIQFEEPTKQKKTKPKVIPTGDQINLPAIINNKPNNKIVREFIGSQLQCVVNEEDQF